MFTTGNIILDTMASKIIYHADDFGISEYSCRRILECCDNGVLQSVAILANSSFYAQAVEMLKPYLQTNKLKLAVHINLVEGFSVTPADRIPHLVDSEGKFKLSFGEMLLRTMLKPNGVLVREIRLEMRNQLKRVLNSFEGCSISIDSHQHFHMIPAVFREVIALIEEMKIPLDHLRFADEPLLPFLLVPSLYRTFRPINIVKNIVLKILGSLDRKYIKGTHYNTTVLFGLLFSGSMDKVRVEQMIPYLYKVAKRRGCDLEVLSHPGGVECISECMSPVQKGFVDFYLSDGRKKEAYMLQNTRYIL